MFILFYTKCFLIVYVYTDLSKPKAYKLFENSDADLFWLLFLKKQICSLNKSNKLEIKYFLSRRAWPGEPFTESQSTTRGKFQFPRSERDVFSLGER